MPLFRLLFLLLLLIPVLEIYLLIKVGSLIGAIPTVGLVVFTAVLGGLLLRHQGVATLQRVQLLLQRGELPTVAMLEGVVILISGALLLTPGFFTDLLGFLGLIPPLRQAFILHLLRGGLIHVQRPPGGTGRHSGPKVIEGDYTRED